MAVVTIGKTGVGGLITDVRPEILPPEIFSDSLNMKYESGVARKLKGSQIVLGAPLVSPVFVEFFPPSEAPNWVYGSNSRIFTARGSSHIEITRLGAPYLGQDTDRWQAHIFNGIGIFNNGADLPQQWKQFTSGTRLENLENFPDNFRIKSIRPFKNFLVVLNIQQIEVGAIAPYRVAWSDIAAPGKVPPNWDIANPASRAGETDLAETPDVIVDGGTLGNIFIIYKENSIWGMRFVGGAPVFEFGKISTAFGLLTKNCFVSTDRGHVVASRSDLVFHSGQQGSEQSILTNRLRKKVFDNIDNTFFYKSYIFKSGKDIWFCYPESGQENCNKAVVWNQSDNTLALVDIPLSSDASVGILTTLPSGAGSWDSPEANTTWNLKEGVWNENTLSGQKLDDVVVASSPGNALVHLESVPLSTLTQNAVLERTLLTIAGVDRNGDPISDSQGVKFIKWFYPLITGTSCETLDIQLGFSNNNNDTIQWQPIQTFIIGQDTRVAAFFATRYLSFRIVSTNNTPWEFLGYKLEVDLHGIYT